VLYRHSARRIFLIVLMLVGLVGPARRALANPSAPAGCIFYVSTTSDGTDADWDLTLREAIMLANGGTGPTGLNRPLTTHEVVYLQLAGSCSFDSNGNVLSGGGGYVDTIRFNNLLGLNPTLTLASNLPGMNDSVGDVIDGSYTSIYPTLNANGNDFGLTVGGPIKSPACNIAPGCAWQSSRPRPPTSLASRASRQNSAHLPATMLSFPP
jgi:hypothetical protein